MRRLAGIALLGGLLFAGCGGGGSSHTVTELSTPDATTICTSARHGSNVSIACNTDETTTTTDLMDRCLAAEANADFSNGPYYAKPPGCP